MDTKNCPACFSSIDARASRCSACGSRQPDAPMMHRDVPGRVLGGVCAALSLQLGWDPVLVRGLFIASLAVTAGLGLWLYALVWLVTPFEPMGKSPISKAVDGIAHLFKTEPPTEAHTGPTDL